MTTIVPNHRTLSLQFPHQAYILLKRPTKNPEKKLGLEHHLTGAIPALDPFDNRGMTTGMTRGARV